MLIGYARVSTQDQDLALQLQALEKAGCGKIFTDQMSGTKADRPGLQEALAYARPEDTLVVWKLDRLGRSVAHLIAFVKDLEGGGVHFRSLTDQIDTSTPAGRFFFHVMAALAEMERDLILERTRAGLAAAKAAGRVGGRPRSLTPTKEASARALLAAGRPRREVAETLGVSLGTLYRWVPGTASV